MQQPGPTCQRGWFHPSAHLQCSRGLSPHSQLVTAPDGELGADSAAPIPTPLPPPHSLPRRSTTGPIPRGPLASYFFTCSHAEAPAPSPVLCPPSAVAAVRPVHSTSLPPSLLRLLPHSSLGAHSGRRLLGFSEDEAKPLSPANLSRATRVLARTRQLGGRRRRSPRRRGLGGAGELWRVLVSALLD
jgi:hypothetical protein